MAQTDFTTNPLSRNPYPFSRAKSEWKHKTSTTLQHRLDRQRHPSSKSLLNLSHVLDPFD